MLGQPRAPRPALGYAGKKYTSSRQKEDCMASPVAAPYRSKSRIDRQLTPIEPCVPAFLELCRSYGPDKECIVWDERRYTYHEIDRLSAILARRLLEAGAGKG